jgi:hypothetical protein
MILIAKPKPFLNGRENPKATIWQHRLASKKGKSSLKPSSLTINQQIRLFDFVSTRNISNNVRSAAARQDMSYKSS